MTSWLGAVLVVLAGAALGQLLAHGTRDRLRELEAWQAALQALASEVDFAARPLPAALREAAEAAGRVCRIALREAAERLSRGDTSGREAWLGALAAARARSPLRSADVASLAALAPALGRTGRDDQIRQIHHCSQRLAVREAEARTTAERDARVVAYLCTLGGMALAVVLL